MPLADLLDAALGRRALLAAAAAGIAALASIEPRRTLYVLGDSWAAGLYADPSRALGQVAAQALGWQAKVDGGSGTGYLVATDDSASYPVRAAAISGVDAQVLVLQGGSNDDGQDHAKIPAAFRATVGEVTARIPGVRILVLGPGPDPLPVTAVQRDVDRVLQTSAHSLGLPYVSMLQQDWIPADSHVLDPNDHHPTVAGQRYLGLKLAAAVRRTFPDITG